MWTIPKTLNTVNINSQLKLSNFGSTLGRSPFVKLRHSFTQVSTTPVTSTATELEVLEDSETLLIPFRTALLYQLEGEWVSESSELTRVFSFRELDINTYIWIDGFTYIISDTTSYSYKGVVQKEVIDIQNFGYFEKASSVVKVVSNGLPLDFVINTDNEIIILSNSNPSCKPRLGDTAEIWLQFNFPEANTLAKELLFFDKSILSTQIDLVTYFTYEGFTYYINNDLDSSTSLINSANNSFFIIT